MATVLQRIKDKRLTAAQERETRVVFELVTEGSEVMTVKQLKLCLRALGFSIAKGEAQTLVYEFDFTDTNTIGFADFQKIFLSKLSTIVIRVRHRHWRLANATDLSRHSGFNQRNIVQQFRDNMVNAFSLMCYCRAMSNETADKISLCQLSSALHATDIFEIVDRQDEGDKLIDGNVLRHQMALQHYADEDIEAVQGFLDSTAELRISKDVLAAFLRI
ncbi:Caltractin [Phytophthora nicotianae]|uniref:Caltractin n=1 Tax=Phytophthora nicotianae TaxID=4792 RepID=A0A0W8CFU8_PHYNI|nr:Caltractin [Phytophthora nicotianae]